LIGVGKRRCARGRRSPVKKKVVVCAHGKEREGAKSKRGGQKRTSMQEEGRKIAHAYAGKKRPIRE